MTDSSSQAPSVLDYLSFQATPPDNMSSHRRMQGVLWKRRDLFKNHWRPRWFVLHQDQHLLTYYLLSNKNKYNRNSRQQPSSSGNRSRTASESSNVSQDTVDYDVVPRGTIYLLGSSVEVNQLLSNPSENLYVMTITDHENATYVHLAARSVEARDEWMHQISLVCNTERRQQLSILSSSTSATTTSATTTATSTEPLTLKNLVQSQLLSSRVAANWNSTETYPLLPEMYPEVEKLLKDVDFNDTSSFSWKERLTAAARNHTQIELSSDVVNELGDVLDKALSSSSTASPSTKTQDSSTISNAKWKTVPTELLQDNVPPSMVDSMEAVLQKYLPYVEQRDHPDLAFKYDANGIHCSVHKTQQLIRSIRTVQDHTAADYLQLLWVFERDLELESNVTLQEPLMQYNAHTSLVYKAYQAVWPTGPREFCSAAHWRLLQNDHDGSLALCLLAFSCPEAEALRPNVVPRHIRGHLEVSLQIWEQTPEGCVHTRILSYDLKGQIPKAIYETVMTQQADLPRLMDAHLTRVKKRSESITAAKKLIYESLYQVLKEQDASRSAKEKGSKKKAKPDWDSESIVDMSSSTGTATRSRDSEPNILLESLVLLGPLLLHRLLTIIPLDIISHAAPFVVLFSVVWSVRWVCLEHLLRYSILLPSSLQPSMQAGTITTATMKGSTRCHFTVNLRSIDRFIERRRGKDENKAQAKMPHIVIRALARAMARNPGLIARQVLPSLPLVYNASMVLHDDTTERACQAIWVPPEEQQCIQAIADFLSSPEEMVQPSIWEAHILGPSCRLWVSLDQTQRNHPPVKIDWCAPDSPLTVVISTYLKRPTGVITTKHLDVSLTFQSSDVAACRSFAKQVQQLVQMPEMCDE